VLFVGNPGAGKSTLLNSLLGQAKFQSGVSFGVGLTQKIQWVEHNGVFYGDTPGLADVKAREQCAVEIEKALKKGGTFKIVFVVSLEAGRVRVGDIATMNLVIDAISLEDVKYGIVVNRLKKNLMNKLTELNSPDTRMLLSCLNDTDNSSRKPTSFVYYYPFVEDLDEADNAVPRADTGFVSFLQSLSETVIKPEQIKTIDINAFKRLQEEVEEKLSRITRLEQTISNMELEKNQYQEALQELALAHQTELQQHKAAHEQRLAEMQQQIIKAERDAARKERNSRIGSSISNSVSGIGQLAGPAVLGLSLGGLLLGVPPFAL
jgi:GTP-binding protein EngB required for normal cell division/chaperonin cofactor prefoldin